MSKYTRKGELLDALFLQVGKEAKKQATAAKKADKAQSIRALLMPCQAELEADTSARIAVRAARRTGKSTGVLLLVVTRCLERASSAWVVVGLVRHSVKKTYWGDLQNLNQAFELGIKFHHQELRATFPNGSTINFVGADNRAEIEKLRGTKYDGVIVDECKSYGPGLFEEMITDVIEPALMDRSGQLYVIGTPGDVMAGPFFLATAEEPVVYKGLDEKERQSNRPYGLATERPFDWSLHQWSLQDNLTKFKAQNGLEYTLWDKALEVKQRHGWPDNHPTWRREYLGHWVPDDGKRVYRYYPHKHDYHPRGKGLGLPGGEDTKWRRVIGFDFGTRDGTTMVVWAYSLTEPGLWEIYSEKRTAEPGQKLPVGAIATWYREVEETYGPFDGWPADWAGLATMVMDTLADEYGVYLEPAEKKEKLDHIELFNNDLDAGRIHIMSGSPLSKELLENRWLEKSLGTERRKEDPATPNDLCDAALYAFRWCRHRQAMPLVHGPAMGTRDWWEAAARAELTAAENKAREANKPKDLDQEWWND